MSLPSALREYNATHINEDCTAVSGRHTDELFYECVFDKLNGLTLENCVLTGSRFQTKSALDARGFTLSLNCHSFRDVEYSEELFDLLLVLLMMTKGNDAKRRKLAEVVGRERLAQILRQIAHLEP